MSKRLLLACVMVLALTLPARAEGTGVYAGIKIIDSIQSAWVDGPLSKQYTQNTLGGGIFAGYDFFPVQNLPIRVEAEYAVRTALNKSYSGFVDADLWNMKYDVNLHTIMGNVYFDLHNSTAFTPYIGAGVGIGIVRANLEARWGGLSREVSDFSTEFAWNVGAGCSYSFNEMVSADLAYRFLDVTEAEIKSTKINLSTHEISLGLRLNF